MRTLSIRIFIFLAICLSIFVGCSELISEPVNEDLHLEFTTTGDDGIMGVASIVELRYSLDSANLINDFEACSLLFVNESPKNPNELDSIDVSAILMSGNIYFFGVRIGDEVQRQNLQFDVVSNDTIYLTYQGRNWSNTSNVIRKYIQDETPPLEVNDLKFRL